jgi:tetratricopeptide (TPR) repeat protein
VWTGNVASIYNQRGDYERALAYFQRSLRLRRKLGMKVEAAIDTGNIGDLYANQEDYLQALNYHSQALQMRHELGDRGGIAVALGNLGRDYARLGEEETAVACFKSALALALELGNWEGIALQLGRLGDMLVRDGDHEHALACLDRSLDLFRRLGSPYYLARRLHAKARALFSLGQLAAAGALSAEAAEMAAGLSADDALSARLLEICIRAARGRLPQDGAIEALLALLPEAERPRQRAAVHYEVWRLAPDSAAGRHSAGRALDLYRRLYHDTYRRQYRQRYERLAGRSLPNPPPLPPLPDMEDVVTPALPKLLARVDDLAADLAGHKAL